MTQSIFVKRYSDSSSEEKYYLNEFKEHINIHSINDFEVIHQFDFSNLAQKEVQKIVSEVFTHHKILNDLSEKEYKLSLQYRKGQYDFIEDQLEKMSEFILGKKTHITHHIIFTFSSVTESEYQIIENYLLNPNEMKISKDYLDGKQTKYTPKYYDLNSSDLEEISSDYYIACEDLEIVKDFYDKENRMINDLELKLIATYWSDHCRHSTFNTEIEKIEVAGLYKDIVEKALREYQRTRAFLNHSKPISLMDLACINAKEIKEKGFLDDWDQSQEVNAASIKIKIKDEDYLLSFKNETHNHPTEIEPYGGASTCIGGCIRDPMSGRAKVYQAMRITGAKNPISMYQKKHPLKLSQRQICQRAALGYSDYANQMGIQSDYLKEYYHDGYEAKRLELGALIASVRAKDVKKLEPKKNDIVIVLGGKTGKDGLGAALGSSKKLDNESLENLGPEVQKGNPINERKLYRLFQRAEFTEKIKRSNDFGAGGLSVAIGELADGIDIYLDKMPLKEAMKADDIALSESQERMAIVIDPKDKDIIYKLAQEENLEAQEVALITDQNRLRMFYEKELLLDISRDLLDTEGANRKTTAIINTQEIIEEKDDINFESQRALREMFSNTNINNEVLQEGMISLIPNKENDYDMVSIMTCGFNPYISNSSPFHAGYLSVIEASSKVIAMGGHPENIRLSFQEYFESLQNDPYKWGNASAALLGAFLAMKELDYPSIGGKDSMSGTFEDLSVPNSIICFAIQTSEKSYNPSREFKKEGNIIALIKNEYDHENLLNIEQFKKNNYLLHQAMKDKSIKACSTIEHSLFHSLKEMCLINQLDYELYLTPEIKENYANYLVEVEDESVLSDMDYEIIGKTIKAEDFHREPSLLDEVYTAHKIERSSLNKRKVSPLAISTNEKAKALIIVIEGTCLELVLERSLEQVGISYKTFVYKGKQDNDALVKMINESNLIFIPDGFKQVNDVFDQGIQYKLLLEQASIFLALNNLIKRKGLLIASGAGAIGLAQSKFFKEKISFESNPNRKHISQIIRIDSGNEASIFTDILNKGHEARLDAYYSHINSSQSIMRSLDKINGRFLNLGIQSHGGQVIASLIQIESDLVLLEKVKEYFDKEEV